jgi:hypothetical protein
MPVLDFTNGKSAKKRTHNPRPIKENGEPMNRNEYHVYWIKNNPDKVERYRVKAIIRNREKAIERLTQELSHYNDMLEKMTSDNINGDLGKI